MNKKWEYNSIDTNKINEISKKYNISNLLSTILVNKNIIEDEEVRLFLNPTRNDFHDPFNMPDMDAVVDRILKAMEMNEKTIIYGDYDVDGITSITVLKRFFKEHGFVVDCYIPNRLNEGYGLNRDAITSIAKEGYKLIITVDCGISANEEIDLANNLGMEVIVTDHHEPLEKLPNAIGIVDCKRKDSKYPFNSLAGVGVSFKLIQAISMRKKLDDKDYLKYLDVVAVGTISDIVPLVDENRVIAKLGLKLLEVTKKPYLKVLLDVSGYKEINSNTVSFGIAPRINASGRMGFEQDALELFLTDNIVKTREIAEKLNSYNRKRQEIEKNIFNEAIEIIEKNELDKKDIIIIGSKNWHHGVIGIVASKITDLYYKPCILVCFEDDVGKGSGRSIPGFDLHSALCEVSDCLDKYGGHEMAIGLSIKKEKFELFKTKMESIASKQNLSSFLPVIKIDMEINQKDVTIDNVKSLSLLEPYGESNNVPIFEYKNLKIDAIRTLLEGKHLKMILKDGNMTIDAIAFNMGSYINDFHLGDKINVVGTLEINRFGNMENIQFNLKDMKKSY